MPGKTCESVVTGSSKEAYDPCLAIVAGLECRQQDTSRLNAQHGAGCMGAITGYRGQEWLGEADGETAGGGNIRSTVGPEGIAEGDRSLLVGQVICSPVIIHHP